MLYTEHSGLATERMRAEGILERVTERARVLGDGSAYMSHERIGAALAEMPILDRLRPLKRLYNAGKLQPFIRLVIEGMHRISEEELSGAKDAFFEAETNYTNNLIFAAGHYYQNQEVYVDMALEEAHQAGHEIYLNGTPSKSGRS